MTYVVPLLDIGDLTLWLACQPWWNMGYRNPVIDARIDAMLAAARELRALAP